MYILFRFDIVIIKTGGVLFDFKNTKLSGNMSLYAHFTTERVNVTFKYGNGTPDFNTVSGKFCLINEPPIPEYNSENPEYVFAGWKEEKSDGLFDFESDRPTEDMVFTAQYKEREYFASYYSLGKLLGKVSFVHSNPTVKGREPEVPEIPNTIGVWEAHSTDNLMGNITVNAVYSVVLPNPSDEIKLKPFDEGELCIITDTVKEYLSLKTDEQTAYVREFCSKPHGFQGYQDILYLDGNQKALYRDALEKMADKDNYPFYFHCSGGADRTGNFAYLIYGLLGVPYKDIRADYELTSFSKMGVRTADVFLENNFFDGMHNDILQRYGDGENIQTAVENFLISYFGVKKSSVDSIKAILKE